MLTMIDHPFKTLVIAVLLVGLLAWAAIRSQHHVELQSPPHQMTSSS